MPIRPADRPKRLFRQIADQITHLIETGEFPLGSRLPAERDLAERLAVSRPSVREALVALEIAGLVEVRGGSGVYVRDGPAPRPAGLGELEVSPFDVLDARMLIESECAALAAERGSDADHARIAQAFERLRTEASMPPDSVDGDAAFHVAIAQASQNTAYAAVVRQLWALRQTPVGRRLDELYLSSERRLHNVAEHRDVLDAILARNPARARRAMKTHLARTARQRLMADGKTGFGATAPPAPAGSAPRPGRSR